MLRKAAIAALFSTLLSGLAISSASAGVTIWSGSLVVTQVTAACTAQKFAPGITFDSVFRPKINSTDPKSALSIIFPLNSAVLFTTTSTTSQMRGVGTYTGNAITFAATPTTFAGSYNFTIAPAATITASTTFIQITGNISTFNGLPGCTVSFRGSYSLYGTLNF